MSNMKHWGGKLCKACGAKTVGVRLTCNAECAELAKSGKTREDFVREDSRIVDLDPPESHPLFGYNRKYDEGQMNALGFPDNL